MINVCFAGITGWAAPPILAAMARADDLALTAGVSRSAAGQSLAAVTGLEGAGSVYASVAEALESASVDVLVDYTSASAVKANVWAAVEPSRSASMPAFQFRISDSAFRIEVL